MAKWSKGKWNRQIYSSFCVPRVWECEKTMWFLVRVKTMLTIYVWFCLNISTLFHVPSCACQHAPWSSRWCTISLGHITLWCTSPGHFHSATLIKDVGYGCPQSIRSCCREGHLSVSLLSSWYLTPKGRWEAQPTPLFTVSLNNKDCT